MNYNANMAPKQPFGRKIKRVSDVNAMGYNPYNQQTAQPPFPNGAQVPQPQQSFTPQPPQSFSPQPMDIQNPAMLQQPTYNQPQNNVSYNNYEPNPVYSNPPQVPGMGVFGQPMVQNMAMQYTQQLASTGTTMMKKEIERYVPVSRLKYYFAVDTKYVLAKLSLLFFPYTHSDWSIKFEQDGPVQPRYEINAPDLYIPAMAYVTYVLLAGFVLGMQNRFSPEQLSIQASSAFAWWLVELAVYSASLYITNIHTSLRTLDLMAYSGYKYVGVIASILLSIIAGYKGYFVTLIYTNLALAFFLVRSLKVQVMSDSTTQQTEYYAGDNMALHGRKRRLNFLLFVAAVQPFLSWWLSFHLLSYTPPAVAV